MFLTEHECSVFYVVLAPVLRCFAARFTGGCFRCLKVCCPLGTTPAKWTVVPGASCWSHGAHGPAPEVWMCVRDVVVCFRDIDLSPFSTKIDAPGQVLKPRFAVTEILV